MLGPCQMKGAFGKKLQSDNDIRRSEPLTDGHPSSFKSLTSYIAGAALGPCLAMGAVFASGGAGMACNSTQNPSPPAVTTAAALTDSNGKAALEVNGWDFTFSIGDMSTSQPVPGVGVLLFAEGSSADYFVLDPQNRYLPFFGGTTGVQNSQVQTQNNSNASDAQPQPLNSPTIGWWNSNVLLTPPTPPLCGVSAGIKIDPAIANWILHSPLFTVEKSGVKLSDLNVTIGQLVSGQAAGTAAQTGLVWALPRVPQLGVSTAAAEALGHDLDGAGWVLLGITACADAQLDAYGNYYRSLCYGDSATFTIYGMNGLSTVQWLANLPLINLFFGFDSPLFAVIPENPDAFPPNSTPPYAIVNPASISVNPPDAGVGNPLPDYNSFDISEVSGRLPPFTVVEMLGVTPTEIVLNACSNFNPTYEISSPSARTYEGETPDVEPATSVPLAVQDKDDYSLNFYLQESQNFSQICPGGYQTYYKQDSGATNDLGGKHHDIAIACTLPNGYPQVSDAGAPASDAGTGLSEPTVCNDSSGNNHNLFTLTPGIEITTILALSCPNGSYLEFSGVASDGKPAFIFGNYNQSAAGSSIVFEQALFTNGDNGCPSVGCHALITVCASPAIPCQSLDDPSCSVTIYVGDNSCGGWNGDAG